MNNPALNTKFSAMADSVRGMGVSCKSSFKYRFGDAGYYLCSTSCEKRFITEPARYLDQEHSVQGSGKAGCHHLREPGTSAPDASVEAIHTRPMDPEMRQVSPGDSPGFDVDKTTLPGPAATLKRGSEHPEACSL